MATQIKFRPGFLDRLERSHGFQTDHALAGAIGVSPAVLSRAKKTEIATAQLLAGISRAFGYGLGEIAYAVETDEPAEQAA